MAPRSKRLEVLTPYQAGEQPQDRRYLKLNTNENPYPPAPAVMEKIQNVDPELLRRYPDPLAVKLRKAIADRFGLGVENIFVGNGSDEVLSFSFFAFFDGPVAFPELTYSFYSVYCDYYAIPYETTPMGEDLSVDLDVLLETGGKNGIILANPNTPTGSYLEQRNIENLLKRMSPKALLIVDEAYIDFGGQSSSKLIQNYDNILIIQTCSKSHSLAGARLGYAIGNPDLVGDLISTKDCFNSYPVDSLAQIIAETAIRDQEYYKEINGRIIETREQFSAELVRRDWIVLPSMSNFVLAGKPGHNGREIYETLKAAGILVRYFDIPKIDKFVRITIGTPKQMTSFLEISGELL